jgi:hypothetical protein
MSAVKIYVPGDSSAVAVGADRVAQGIERLAREKNREIEIVRNGSRGLYWLEPMVEVATPEGRIAYGPVSPGDLGSLFDADFLGGGAHALRLGKPEEIPFLKNQERLMFALRHHRSALDRRIPGAWRLSRSRESAADAAPADRRRSDGIRVARPRRCRLPDRNQVEDGAGDPRRAEVHRLQCG